jgi:hypothetical protein
VVSLLLLASGILVLTAAAGLWRLPDFFLRLHAAALPNTLASWAVALASAIPPDGRHRAAGAAPLGDRRPALHHRADHHHAGGTRRPIPLARAISGRYEAQVAHFIQRGFCNKHTGYRP